MKLVDLKIDNHLHKPFARNKDFSGYVDQQVNIELSADARLFGQQKAHMLHELSESFEGEKSPIFDLEMQISKVLIDVEVAGVYIDQEELKDLEKQMEEKIAELQKMIFADMPNPINLNSPQQLQKFLFEDKGIEPIRKTKTGWSVDEETLKILAEEHEICKHIIEYRHLTKLVGTYTKGLAKHIDSRTKRIHSSFVQTGTTTGRISSDSPNLQNIPAGDMYSDAVKGCFKPQGTDSVFLVADYSQVELRILACLSKDKNLLQAFKDGEDIHALTAKAVFETEDISPNQRSQAKAINFGVMYGITGFGLSKMIPITPNEGKEYIERFYARYPNTRKYFQEIIEFTQKNGYVETFFGRKRWLPNINDANSLQRQAAEREAMNMPIQGTCADIIKFAMVRIHEEFKKRDLKSQMIIQVHDELVFEVPKSEQEEVSSLVREIMEGVVDWEIPLIVNVGVGENWSAAK